MSDDQSTAPPSSPRSCATRPLARRALPPSISPRRARLIIEHRTKWVNGTILHYCLLEQPSTVDLAAIRQAFAEWQSIGLGVRFEEVKSPQEAELRISFQDDGSWSYIGRDALQIRDPHEATMNFGWPLTPGHGYDTALHEIGHALGFEHEHHSRRAGIVWDEEAVYRYFSGSPNFWSQETIDYNVLRKIPMSAAKSTPWDRDSIMHYAFEAGLIRFPQEYRTRSLDPKPGLSATDKAEARRMYPHLDGAAPLQLLPLHAHKLALAPGEQIDFCVRPDSSRDYSFQVFGQADTNMVLFELIDGKPRYVQGFDDGGLDDNAALRQRLVRGREYLLRVRLYYADVPGQLALMHW